MQDYDRPRPTAQYAPTTALPSTNETVENVHDQRQRSMMWISQARKP